MKKGLLVIFILCCTLLTFSFQIEISKGFYISPFVTKENLSIEEAQYFQNYSVLCRLTNNFYISTDILYPFLNDKNFFSYSLGWSNAIQSDSLPMKLFLDYGFNLNLLSAKNLKDYQWFSTKYYLYEQNTSILNLDTGISILYNPIQYLTISGALKAELPLYYSATKTGIDPDGKEYNSSFSLVSIILPLMMFYGIQLKASLGVGFSF